MIRNFNANLCNLVNESFALGVKIPEERLVRKAVRSLSLIFPYKAPIIREAKDLKAMKLKELMGSL